MAYIMFINPKGKRNYEFLKIYVDKNHSDW